MMAKYICRKIAEGQDLWLVRVDSEEWKPYVAIFAPGTALDDKSLTYTFVSSGYDRESKYDRTSFRGASGTSLSFDSTTPRRYDHWQTQCENSSAQGFI